MVTLVCFSHSTILALAKSNVRSITLLHHIAKTTSTDSTSMWYTRDGLLLFCLSPFLRPVRFGVVRFRNPRVEPVTSRRMCRIWPIKDMYVNRGTRLRS